MFLVFLIHFRNAINKGQISEVSSQQWAKLCFAVLIEPSNAVTATAVFVVFVFVIVVVVVTVVALIVAVFV